MSRRTPASVLLVLIGLLATAAASAPASFGLLRPGSGSAGVGDPYFPKAGNGGYDVAHYTLDLTYRPGSDRLSGVATIDATATKRLTRYHLDLSGMRVLSVLVEGRPAQWSRRGQELRVEPSDALPRGELFRTVVTYTGVPQTLPDGSGFIHTEDGALVMGEPKGAATWFPVNDHPSDKASYTFRIRAPRDREVVANGALVKKRTVDGWTTWEWDAVPMASYLATIDVGGWRFDKRTVDGIRIVDAVDSKLFRPLTRPHTGDGFAIARGVDSGYQRLRRTITVPADGARLSFWVDRHLEPDFDFFAVEAHTAGQNDWTTLPDLNGHSHKFPGASCPQWLELHPFLRHYMQRSRFLCSPQGTTGRWTAASGGSRGYQRWVVDLSPYAGKQVEVSLTTVSDEVVSHAGAFVDDISVSTGEGSTSFEADGDVLDGWHASNPPAGSPPVASNWTAGTLTDAPSRGSIVQESLDLAGPVIQFLEGRFGPYPFSQAGGTVDRRHVPFALETQTRPTYGIDFFDNKLDGDSVVVHELAHQWVGDSLTVKRWRHIWLNEGFATYSEWMWYAHTGLTTPQAIFDDFYSYPARNGFWNLRIGNPGPRRMFDDRVYFRGAMTLQALRVEVGDDAFFTILRQWAQRHAGGLVTTGKFVRLAERVSGRQLDHFFHQWLFSTDKPSRPSGMPVAPRRSGEAGSPVIRKLVNHRLPH